MVWFEALTGIREDVDRAGSWLSVDGEWLISRRNGRRMRWGRLVVPSLAELRAAPGDAVSLASPAPGDASHRAATSVSEVIADVRQLHLDPVNRGATFQVASQFNLLEMAAPTLTPDDGIERYELDHTQGPACALACGAGTIYRNYLVPLDDHAGRRRRGQTADRQLDTLADLGRRLGNRDGRLWTMRNGYALATEDGLAEIATTLDRAADRDRAELAGLLRIGLQLDTEVTADDAGHVVDQAYCSALPVAYGQPPPAAWEPFARLVLEAAYEATLLAAVRKRSTETGRDPGANSTVFLTLLGGGVFGNETSWIVEAIGRALAVPAIADAGLDVRIVSHAASNPAVQPLLTPP